MRNRAENLVRNVLLHQLTNAIEESEAALSRQMSPRRSKGESEFGDRSVLKGLLGGHYRKQVSFGRKGSPGIQK